MQTIITEINDNTALEVYWQDEVVLEIDVALLYIQSGQQDIKNYVESVSKPEIDSYVKSEAKPIVADVVNNITSSLIDNYLNNNTIPSINEYTAQQISIYNDNAATKQNAIDLKVQIVEDLTAEVNLKTKDISNQVSLAKQYATSAQSSEKLCLEAQSMATISADSAASNAQKINELISEAKVEISKELNNPFSLLDYKWSEYELNNASWLISNGAFHSGATYPSVYELLLKIQGGAETKDGVSVKLSTEAYADIDFVINTADTTFRLPIKVKLASGNAVVGNGMTLGLTNGTHNMGVSGIYAGNTSTLSTSIDNYGDEVSTTGGGQDGTNTAGNILGVTESPEKSGIETSSDGLKLYFYVGETVQDANIINASGVLTRVAELSNEYIVGLGMPDYSAVISVTYPLSSNPYTAPCDGMLCPWGKPSDTAIRPIINGVKQDYLRLAELSAGSGGYQGRSIYLSKGDVIYFDNSYSVLNGCVFYPFKGVN